ncbi:MAG: PKD domain-containing protein, partial [Taibaiella sp.]|nr:PKD domain-containing protein [Taibaiella sp.]
MKFDGAGNPVWSKQVENLGSAQPVQYGEEILIEGDIVSICGTEYVSCDIDFDIPVVGISNTSFWAEYFDGIVVGPTADFSGNPTSVEEGQSVTYTDLSSDGTNPITSWNWTFEGGTPGTFSGQNPPAIAYATAGTYDVTLVVSDGSQADTELKTDYITVNSATPPTADFSGTPLNGEAPLEVSFTDLSVAGTNPITSWTWSFEGGTPGTFSGQNPPAIAYAIAGTYDVTLMVSDGSLSDTETKVDYVVVSAPAPTASYTPDVTQVSATAGNVYSDFETNEVSAVNVLSGDVGAAVSPINLGTGTTNVELSYPANLDLAAKQFIVTATTAPNNLVVTWTVNQDGTTPSMELNPSSAAVNADITSVSTVLSTQSDMTWTVDDSGLPTGWSVAPMSGTGNDTFVVTLTVNTGTDPINGSFSINGTGLGAGTTVTFPITQLGAGAPLVASAASDKSEYFIGETMQLYGSATGGTGSYSYEWTGTGGFTSSLQNPTFEPMNVGTYTFTVVVDDGENTDTDNVVVTVDELSIYLESSTQNALTGVPVTFTIFAELKDGSLASVDEVIFETDGDELTGFVNPWEFEYVYQNIGGSPYDVEVTVITSTGFIMNVSYPNYMDVIVSVGEQPTKNSIEIYPNP